MIAILSALLLAACASYNGIGLKPGVARLEDVLNVMGKLAMQWQEADGSRQLAYPRGIHTFMVDFGVEGKMKKSRIS